MFNYIRIADIMTDSGREKFLVEIISVGKELFRCPDAFVFVLRVVRSTLFRYCLFVNCKYINVISVWFQSA